MRKREVNETFISILPYNVKFQVIAKDNTVKIVTTVDTEKMRK